MSNNVQTKAETPVTEQEISEKYNGGKKVIDFVGMRKIFFIISLFGGGIFRGWLSKKQYEGS